MLTVKDFIKETLMQITDAAKEFEMERSGADGATVTPEMSGYAVNSANKQTLISNSGLLFLGAVSNEGSRYDGSSLDNASYAAIVEFDIAVSATDTETAATGGKLAVMPFVKVGAELGSETANSSISRVAFKLPLRLV
ncbi:MAG: hypothetical protein RIF37_08780 [Rhodospirillaceae bacterium]